MLFEFKIKTEKQGFYDVTTKVREALVKSAVKEGICIVYCPHTTAGITINENADPDVVHDMLYGFDKVFHDRAEFKHMEGNSAAHIKSSITGSSKTVIISEGSLLLGIWQGIYFCEFDGPRNRTFYIKIIGG